MLVLTRRRDESLLVGDAVITVSELSACRAKLAVSAPSHVRVLRSELLGEEPARFKTEIMAKINEAAHAVNCGRPAEARGLLQQTMGMIEEEMED